MRTKVIIGNKYGKLTPLEIVGTKNGCLLYHCECDCGNTIDVVSRRLTEGKTRSCGCLRSKSKNMHNSATYKSWISAKQRCYNPNNHNYPKYGGRGIKMCDRWKGSFVLFLEDMGERTSKEYTLDRIDVNGDYEPSNCRWATHRTQGNNRRDNVFLDVNGERLTVSEFSVKYNINRSNVDYELRNGLSVNEIIEKYSNMELLLQKRRKACADNLKKAKCKRDGTPKIDFIEVNELEERERGLNGYGSTDKKINQ